MSNQQINFYTNWLQQENYKSFYLAFLRVAISCWLLKEVCINWQSMDVLYEQATMVVSKNSLAGRLILLIGEYYRWLLLPYLSLIFLNILGIGKWFTALLLFVMVHFLNQVNISLINNGNIMARLILLYLIFADSYQYFVLVKQYKADPGKRKFINLLSNLAAFSIMLQLCVAYFTSGFAKLTDPLWFHGQGTYYALLMERFRGTPFNTYLARQHWIDFITNYGTMLFELLFPVLIWIQRFRKPLLVIGFIFHLCIYVFLMIYGFQIVFLLMYGLFLPNQKLVEVGQGLKKIFFGKINVEPNATMKA